MSLEFREYIDKENLELQCQALRNLVNKTELSNRIDDFVCDCIHDLACEGIIKNRESVDVAYYITDKIKDEFIL